MNIYMGMLVLLIVLTPVLGGTYRRNKQYIIVATLILFGVCAMRGIRIGADLGRYEVHYYTCSQLDFSGIFAKYQWDNIGFYFLIKILQIIFGYDFHSFLFILAIFEGIVLARIIYKYSANPYMSFLLYMALGYYVFIYSGLKQALATAFIYLAFDAIIEHKKIRFIICVVLATSVHLPAFIFLPAYYIAYRKLNIRMIVIYIATAVGIFVFKEQIFIYMTDMYDSVVSTTQIGGVGGKVIMMLAFLIGGYLLRIPDGEDTVYLATFNIVIVATLLQLFAVYGNVFERLADYYFVFSILFLSLVFEKMGRREKSVCSIIPYDDQICNIANVGILVFSVVYFYLNVTATYGLLPFSFN